jgi:ubiquitin-conjugating enzyme E2 J2
MTTLDRITQKRLIGELKLLKKEPLDNIDTYPDEKNQLLWYFLMKGLDKGHYEGGYYIGKVLHSPNYPASPPDFMMLTPNGRFEINKKICLSNSGYHSDEWTAAWNMRAILSGFSSIMEDDLSTGLSHIKRPASERHILAKESLSYNITHHKDIWLGFTKFVNTDGTLKSAEEQEAAKVKKPKKVTVKGDQAKQDAEVSAEGAVKASSESIVQPSAEGAVKASSESVVQPSPEGVVNPPPKEAVKVPEEDENQPSSPKKEATVQNVEVAENPVQAEGEKPVKVKRTRKVAVKKN